ncbi:hypothetical protein ACFQX6_63350 [Streptosporangium lutulentum]
MTILLLPAALLFGRGLISAPMSEQPPLGARSSIVRRLGWAVLVAVGAALMQYGGAARGAGLILLLVGLATLGAALPRLLPRAPCSPPGACPR